MAFPQSSGRLDFRFWPVAIAAWALTAAVFFRQALSSSFGLVFGDKVDGSLIIYLHEHLVRALADQADFFSPPFFYPQANVLGFTDAFLLDIPLYGVLRLLGFDMFLSEQLLIVALSFICFAATLTIGTRYLAVRPGLAICAALLVTFPNNLFYQATAGHLNFFALYYVPCIALLGLWGLDGFPRLTVWSYLRMGAAGLVFGLLFATAFYLAWMLALMLVFAVVIAGVLERPHVFGFLSAHKKPVAIVLMSSLAGFAIGVIPCFLIYLPVLAIVSGRTYRDYITYAPTPKDIINVSTGNLLWGRLIQHLPLNQGHEWPIATTPAMTAIALLLGYRLRRHERNRGGRSWQTTFAICCLGAWFAAWLLTAKIGTVSFFWLAYKAIPGATAIRAGGRIQLIANIGVVLALAVLLTRSIETAAFKSRAKMLAGGIVLLCLIEQLNVLDVARLPRTEKLQWLAAVPMPPAECRSFLVDDRSVVSEDLFYETDAMWMTLKTGLPTLNGYSGWAPPGWPMRDSPDYFAAARQWIARNKMDGVCLYDRPSRRWSPFF